MASKFPDGVDNFQMAWNVSRWPGMFLVDGLGSLWWPRNIIWSVSRRARQFPDSPDKKQCIYQFNMYVYCLVWFCTGEYLNLES